MTRSLWPRRDSMGVSAGPPWALASCSQGIVVSSRSAEDADVCAVIDHKNVWARLACVLDGLRHRPTEVAPVPPLGASPSLAFQLAGQPGQRKICR